MVKIFGEGGQRYPQTHDLSSMRTTLVQTDLVWEDPAANRIQFEVLLAPLAGITDLVLLPEMFTTGFSMRPEALAETMDGETVNWMLEHARRLDAVVCGSFICNEAGLFYNRLIVAFPDGKTMHYDKRHRFSLAGEHKHYAMGTERLIFEWRGWRICPMICYDLRFPVWNRQQNDRYDLIFFVANWPARRANHWRSLLPARSIENQAFVAGVNIIGTDGNGHEYTGDSMLLDHAGNEILPLGNQKGAFTTELSLDDLQKYRSAFPFLDDADLFVLNT